MNSVHPSHEVILCCDYCMEALCVNCCAVVGDDDEELSRQCTERLPEQNSDECPDSSDSSDDSRDGHDAH